MIAGQYLFPKFAHCHKLFYLKARKADIVASQVLSLKKIVVSVNKNILTVKLINKFIQKVKKS